MPKPIKGEDDFEMKNIVQTFAATALAAAMAFCAHAAEQAAEPPAVSKYVPAGWTEDFGAARRQAAKEGKFVFAAFSGSDWCGPCIAQEKEVFSQKKFLDEISKRYVPVMVSVPGDKSALSALALAQNDELKSRYEVRGFPTVVVVDPSGGAVVRRNSGYRSGAGVGAYLERIEEMMKGVEWPKAGGIVKPLPKIEKKPEGNSDKAAWHTDPGEALKMSKSTGKRLLVYFSWSLESGPFTHDPEFLSYATNRYVLVFVYANGEEFKDKYPWACNGRSGFPDCRIFESDGSMIAMDGREYVSLGGDDDLLRPGGQMLQLVKGFELARLIMPGVLPETDRDVGPSELARIHDALSALPERYVNHKGYIYRKWVERLIAADPDGSRGYRAAYPYFAKVLPRINEISRGLENFQRLLYKLARERLREAGVEENSTTWNKYVDVAYGELADEWEPKFAEAARRLDMMEADVPAGDSRFMFDKFKRWTSRKLDGFQRGRRRR